MERFGGKQSGGSGSGKGDPGKSGPGPGKSPLVDAQPSAPVGTSSGPSAPVPTAAQAASTMAALNITAEVASFGNAGVAKALVDALPDMKEDKEVAKHTIALFQYMDTHGAALTAKITSDFDVLVEPHLKNTYLLELQTAMSPKLGGKGLWVGDDDRGMIAAGAEPLAPFFHKGKLELLAKATQVQAQHRRLSGLLDNLAMNMEAKSYGRRAESMGLVDVGIIPLAQTARPQVGVPHPCIDPRCSYISDVTYLPVLGTALQAGQEYSMAFNGSENLGVTVQSNDGTHVVFSAIT